MTLAGARLTVAAPIDGQERTGTFDLSSDVEVDFSPGANALASFQDGTIGTIARNVLPIDDSAEFRIDGGAGIFRVSVSARSFEGSDGQWGDGSGNPVADATGQSALRQASVLAKYLDAAEIGSQSGAATLSAAEFSPSGAYSPLGVAPADEPSISFAAEDPSAIDISIQFVNISSVTRAVSEVQDDR